VVDCHRVGGDGSPGIDQERAPLLIDPPKPVYAARDVLPSDLADIVRTTSRGLQVDYPDAFDSHRSEINIQSGQQKSGMFRK
jgi:hypothetical protein